MEDLNIIINGKKYTARQGENILQTAKRMGIHIPTLCHDPRLEPYSSCFVCVVEIEGIKSLQPACSTPVREGMSIETENERVRKARKSALDLLVSNHYADCVAPCKLTCPAGVDVQGYISLMEKRMYREAVALIKEVNPLPAICGRVCVRPCEVACRRNLLDEGTGVGIDYLKRFAADSDLYAENTFLPDILPSTGKKVAVIGAGPGGLSVAWFLQQKGHQVDVFEASPHPGGMLRYGIPPYRLPNELLDAEVATITRLGARIFYQKKLGENLSYKEISENYQATVLTIGSQKGTGVGCKGDDAGHVFSGIDFLRNIEMTGQKPDFSGKTVAVIGGGNTAMDCCRTAMRLGAEKVYVVYRRTEKEMPANPIEIHESKEEGIEYLFLNNPVEINKDEQGNIRSMTLIKMELGEPDSSGRRRPVPVDGSEYDLEVDYVLAAIGQKTQVNFIEDINEHAGAGELKINRWGDIDANRDTLQTGIPNVFAAGDGVTGPATLIEAIAQARIAANSCHQFLTGQIPHPEKTEFISRKDYFKTLNQADFKGHFVTQARQEMPLIPPSERQNFKEVELGYHEEMALEETARCLECGCTEYFTCELKALCDEYGAEQTRFAGAYQSWPVRFDHPWIEIDNNKCILCSRCIRICREVAGASALGLVNRGFETRVAPAMGKSLTDTECESCGLCISACPTGAITENKVFKPGPVRLEKKESICHYCSVGCSLEIGQKNGYTWEVTGHAGLANPDGNLCRFGKFGYAFRNQAKRVMQPLVKTESGFQPVSFDEAFRIIREKAGHQNNLVFAGSRLSNEELYLLKRFARETLNTEDIGSFLYMGRSGYEAAVERNVPFNQLNQAGHIFLFGSEIHQDHGVAGFYVNTAKNQHGVRLSYLSIHEQSKLQNKADETILIDSYYDFIRAVNHYLLSTGKENSLFIRDHVVGFESWKNQVLQDDYHQFVYLSGVRQEAIETFADTFNLEQRAVIICSEKELSPNEMKEVRNLCLITGKLGKTASGMICLREKNNSQGLMDLGISQNNDLTIKLESDAPRNLFIFGEDPLGTAVYPEEAEAWLDQSGFVMVQDYFLTETALKADLILPASLPGEFSGSFTNSQKTIQLFEHNLEGGPALSGLDQLMAMIHPGSPDNQDQAGIHEDFLNYVADIPRSDKLQLEITRPEAFSAYFSYGCDALTKQFEEAFENAFIQANKKTKHEKI